MIRKAENPGKKPPAPLERVLTFHVEGLGGLACERRVETAVEAIPGVRQARARSDLGVLEVFVCEEEDRITTAVMEAVEATGHRVQAERDLTS